MENSPHKLSNREWMLTTSVLMLIPSMTITMQQYVNASPRTGLDCDSIVGCYANGYELGKEAGAEDAREGRNHDSKCPPNDSLSFCTGYKAGYEVGWIAQRTLSE
jgi:hypothetical protein